MALIAHLRDDAKLLLGTHQQLRLPVGMRQRLLDEDVLLHRHREHRRREVRVIRRRDTDRVDVALHLLQHLAEVRELRHAGELLEVAVDARRLEVHVTKGDRLGLAAGADRGDDAGAAPADADHGEVDALARRQLAVLRAHSRDQVRWEHRESEAGGSGLRDEVAASSTSLSGHADSVGK